jgi:hypothetical protein
MSFPEIEEPFEVVDSPSNLDHVRVRVIESECFMHKAPDNLWLKPKPRQKSQNTAVSMGEVVES